MQSCFVQNNSSAWPTETAPRPLSRHKLYNTLYTIEPRCICKFSESKLLKKVRSQTDHERENVYYICIICFLIQLALTSLTIVFTAQVIT